MGIIHGSKTLLMQTPDGQIVEPHSISVSYTHLDVYKRQADVVVITNEYEKAGASACSILTDEPYFKGKDQDITDARPTLSIPILRKDFIIDPYQIVEAKILGADLILLIAECLSKEERCV